MGFNTVAVLLNDWTHDIEREKPDLAAAMRAYTIRRQRPDDLRFKGGEVISQDHASGTQVVVVHGNTGWAVNSRDGEREQLDALADVLRSRGYGVRYPGDKRARPPENWNKEHWIE